jgi:hypothetical protein
MWVAGAVFALAAVAACGQTQTGGPTAGYTDNVANLQVKVSALRADPCRSTQAPQIFGSCGRYVTEVSNTVVPLHDALPAQATVINAMAAAVHTFQSMTCDTISGQPSATQAAQCPTALTEIGSDLDKIGPLLASAPGSTP